MMDDPAEVFPFAFSTLNPIEIVALSQKLERSLKDQTSVKHYIFAAASAANIIGGYI